MLNFILEVESNMAAGRGWAEFDLPPGKKRRDGSWTAHEISEAVGLSSEYELSRYMNLRKVMPRLYADKLARVFFNDITSNSATSFLALHDKYMRNFLEFNYGSRDSIPNFSCVAAHSTNHEFYGRLTIKKALSSFLKDDNSCVVINGIGGQGKSTLVWNWLTGASSSYRLKDRLFRGYQRVLWYSFYASLVSPTSDPEDIDYSSSMNAFSYRNFIHWLYENLFYERLSRHSFDLYDTENKVLGILLLRPYLLVLDGLERLLNNYRQSRFDYGPASPMQDDEFSDYRYQRFFFHLLNTNKSKMIVTTRQLPPLLLHNSTSHKKSITHINLDGISHSDALRLWKSSFSHLGSPELITFSRAELATIRQFFKRSSYHALTIAIVARSVASSPLSRFCLTEWVTLHGINRISDINIVNFRSDIMHFALSQLTESQTLICAVASCFLQVLSIRLLCELTKLIVGVVFGVVYTDKMFDTDAQVLMHRGVIDLPLGRRAFEIHPVVRAILFQKYGSVYSNDVSHATIKYIVDLTHNLSEQNIRSIEDLNIYIILMEAFINVEKYAEAFAVYRNRLSRPMLFKLNCAHERVELLNKFLDDFRSLRISHNRGRGEWHYEMGLALQFTGQIRKAREHILAGNDLWKSENISISGRSMTTLADVSRYAGVLQYSIHKAEEAFARCREESDIVGCSISSMYITLALSIAVGNKASLHIDLMRRILEKEDFKRLHYWYLFRLSESLYYCSDFASAKLYAQESYLFSQGSEYDAMPMQAVRMMAAIASEELDYSSFDRQAQIFYERYSLYDLEQERIPFRIAEAWIKREHDNEECLSMLKKLLRSTIGGMELYRRDIEARLHGMDRFGLLRDYSISSGLTLDEIKGVLSL